jgi:hypothetical protein
MNKKIRINKSLKNSKSKKYNVVKRKKYIRKPIKKYIRKPINKYSRKPINKIRKNVKKSKSISNNKITISINNDYNKRLEEFKKFCKEKNIDINNRRKLLYKFFVDKDFIYSKSINNHYDFGIEDVFGVYTIDPIQRPQDKQFLLYIYKQYPKEMAIIQNNDNTKDRLTLNSTSRFANNDTYMFIDLFKNYPNVLIMLKDILLYCILSNGQSYD